MVPAEAGAIRVERGKDSMNIGIVVFLAAFAMIFLTGMPIALGMLSVGVIYMLATGGNMGVIPNCICEAY